MTTSEVMQTAIETVLRREDLTRGQAREVMNTIMTGGASDAQIASVLTGLRMKGESIDEITAFAEAMSDHAEHIAPQSNALDIVGTGGDKAFTFNISTTASFVIAASGIKVTKHGNRSSSSKSGSADCIEALGIDLSLTPQAAEFMLNEINMTFLFSQTYHKAMKFVAKARKDMGTRTIMNVLGPLVNPAKAEFEMMGVYDVALTDKIAKVFANLGLKRAMVFGGNDGIDEITTTTTSEIAFMHEGKVEHMTFDPADYGIPYAKPEDLTGGNPRENAQITLDILSGKDRGPKLDIVICNAGLAIYLVKDGYSINDGLNEARRLIENGQALAKLNEMRQISAGLILKEAADLK